MRKNWKLIAIAALAVLAAASGNGWVPAAAVTTGVPGYDTHPGIGIDVAGCSLGMAHGRPAGLRYPAILTSRPDIAVHGDATVETTIRPPWHGTRADLTRQFSQPGRQHQNAAQSLKREHRHRHETDKAPRTRAPDDAVKHASNDTRSDHHNDTKDDGTGDSPVRL